MKGSDEACTCAEVLENHASRESGFVSSLWAYAAETKASTPSDAADATGAMPLAEGSAAALRRASAKMAMSVDCTKSLYDLFRSAPRAGKVLFINRVVDGRR